MDAPSPEPQLGHISTIWSVVQQAHEPPAEAARAAQEAIPQRYDGVIRRYLLGALGDPEAAGEVFQEFCLRLLRGDLRGAHPQFGRFRDLVRSVLIRLVVDHQRQRQRLPRFVAPDTLQAVVASPEVRAERDFLERWREALLERS